MFLFLVDRGSRLGGFDIFFLEWHTRFLAITSYVFFEKSNLKVLLKSVGSLLDTNII